MRGQKIIKRNHVTKMNRKAMRALSGDNLDRRIAERIREARLNAGLTQQELGDRVMMKYFTVSFIERGKISVPAPDLVRIAEVCRVPIDFFFSDDEPGEPGVGGVIEKSNDAPKPNGVHKATVEPAPHNKFVENTDVNGLEEYDEPLSSVVDLLRDETISALQQSSEPIEVSKVATSTSPALAQGARIATFLAEFASGDKRGNDSIRQIAKGNFWSAMESPGFDKPMNEFGQTPRQFLAFLGFHGALRDPKSVSVRDVLGRSARDYFQLGLVQHIGTTEVENYGDNARR